MDYDSSTTLPESPAAPPRVSKRPRHGHEAPLPDEVIVEHILTRVPAADVVRFRAVCRNWRAMLTSDHFVRAHQAVRAATASPPEIVFYAPGAGAGSTAFYSSKLYYKSTTPQSNGSSPEDDDVSALARELVTLGDLRANDLVLSGGGHGLTLLFQPGESAYHVFNLATGEHVSLPPCALANRTICYGYSPYVLSSAGLGFHAADDEHKVVRLFEDWGKRQRCEVYGLRSGGWRPIAGEVPRHVAKGLNGRPPVFVDGCFYWHINTSFNFGGTTEDNLFRTPEPILSLSVDTERFAWVPPPEGRDTFHLAELDNHLCAVVDIRGVVDRQYELWIRTAVAGQSTPPSWSLRCRINFGSLPRPTRDAMGRAIRMLPIGSSGGRILLATSRHEVYAYDPERNNADRVFDMQDFIDAPREPMLLLNIAMHEETVTGVRRRPVAGDVGKLKVKLGRSSVARRGGGSADRQHGRSFTVTQQHAQPMFSAATALYRYISKRHARACANVQ